MESQVKELIERGRRSYERGDYVAALADFREVLTRHPQFADIRHLAGLCLSFLGQSEGALEEFDRALALNDQYVEAHLNRALVLNDLGRFDEARTAFERAGYYEYAVAGRFPAAITARLANKHAEVGDLYQEAGAPTEAAFHASLALSVSALVARGLLRWKVTAETLTRCVGETLLVGCACGLVAFGVGLAVG